MRRAGQLVPLLLLALPASLPAALPAPARAAVVAEQGPPAAQVRAVEASLLTPARAKRATGFTSPLLPDLQAGEAGRSCYTGSTTWTCDGWFTTDRTSTPFPNGVSITVAASEQDARQVLAELAAKSPDPTRPKDRVLESTATSLIRYQTGFAVGADLRPAVSVTVERVQGRLLIMGTCQVELRKLRLAALRGCANRLQSAQALRVADLSV